MSCGTEVPINVFMQNYTKIPQKNHSVTNSPQIPFKLEVSLHLTFSQLFVKLTILIPTVFNGFYNQLKMSVQIMLLRKILKKSIFPQTYRKSQDD